jgi:hypothetical protein
MGRHPLGFLPSFLNWVAALFRLRINRFENPRRSAATGKKD